MDTVNYDYLWLTYCRIVLESPSVVSNDFGSTFFPFLSIRRGYRCDRLLRTRIGDIVGIPQAKAEEYLAAPAEESTGAPAQVGDPMDLQPGQ